MNKLAGLLLTAVAFAAALAAPAGARAQTPITIIHVNDTHSHLDSFGPRDANLEGSVGGLERAATLIRQLRATENNDLFLHAGDAFHGDFVFNALLDVPEYSILKQLGVDAMTVGNHEFDLTPWALNEALRQVGDFPMISANLDFSACAEPSPCAALAPRVQKHLIREIGGVKVGIFGMTIPTDATMKPDPVKVDMNVVPIAAAEVAALRAAGANVVVFLSHLGRVFDAAVVKYVPGIDVVVQGHDHVVYQAPALLDGPNGTRVPAVCVGDNYLYVGHLKLLYTPGSGVQVESWEALPVDSSVAPDAQVAATVDAAKAMVAMACGFDPYRTLVGFAAFDITRKYDPDKQRRDTAMGNLVTDALRRYTGTDIALSVTGLIGEELYQGPLVAADVFRPVSYGYGGPCDGLGVSTFEIMGLELLKGMETCLGLSAQAGSDTYDLQFSGLRYKLDSSRPAGQRVDASSMRVGEEPFDPLKTYTVTTNSAIPELLPKLQVKIGNVRNVPGVSEYRLLRDYVQALGTVDYTSESRIRDVAALPSADNQ